MIWKFLSIVLLTTSIVIAEQPKLAVNTLGFQWELATYQVHNNACYKRSFALHDLLFKIDELSGIDHFDLSGSQLIDEWRYRYTINKKLINFKTFLDSFYNDLQAAESNKNQKVNVWTVDVDYMATLRTVADQDITSVQLAHYIQNVSPLVPLAPAYILIGVHHQSDKTQLRHLLQKLQAHLDGLSKQIGRTPPKLVITNRKINTRIELEQFSQIAIELWDEDRVGCFLNFARIRYRIDLFKPIFERLNETIVGVRFDAESYGTPNIDGQKYEHREYVENLKCYRDANIRISLLCTGPQKVTEATFLPGVMDLKKDITELK